MLRTGGWGPHRTIPDGLDTNRNQINPSHSTVSGQALSFASAWLIKYIFAGGYVLSLSQIIASAERGGLMVTDVEVLRGHYAETLRHWSDRFAARRAAAKALYHERFCRMWEFYLAAAEAGFRTGDNVVFQVPLVRTRDALPQTRGYMERRPGGGIGNSVVQNGAFDG